MMNNTTQPKKRGRKPLGERAMTAAEAKRRSRARLVADGSRAEFMISLSGETLRFVDSMAENNDVSRARVVQEFLDMAIRIVQGAVAHAGQMLANGASMDEIQAVMRQAFAAPTENSDDAQQEVPPTK